MNILAAILTLAVAIEHIYILYVEMFAWTTKGKRIFRGALPDHLFEETRGLAANQGLYNGFLAVGLLWGVRIEDPDWGMRIRLFFLGCVIVAALFGAIRSSRSILLKQGLPAILAFVVELLACYL